MVEAYLKNKFNKKHCLLVGSGTTAIYLWLRSLNLRKDDYILLPAITCYAPAYAVKYAGFNIELCDINPATGLMDLEKIREQVENNKKIKAIIAVHSYGNCIQDIKSINKYCQENSIYLIEDIAQSYGNKLNGIYCGSFSANTVLSFGNDKIMNNGHGGALLTDDEEIFQKSIDIYNLLDFDFLGYEQEKLEHRKVYYTIKDNIDQGKKSPKVDIWRDRMNLFIFKLDDAYVKTLKTLIKNEDKIIEDRKKILSLFISQFLEIDYNFVYVTEESLIPWRFTILLEQENYNFKLAEYLRSKDVQASTWYPNLQYFFEETYNKSLPFADSFSRKVLNFKIESNMGYEEIKRSAELTKHFLKQHN